MLVSSLYYLLLTFTGILGLGFGTVLPAVQASWPASPWVGPAAAGLHFIGAAAGAGWAGRWARARPEAWVAAGAVVLGASALLTPGVFRPEWLLLLRLTGGVGAGVIGVAALEHLLEALPREMGAAAAGGAAAAVSAGAAIAFWGGPRLIPEMGWQGAVALPGGGLLGLSLAVLVFARRTDPAASPMAAASRLPLRRLLPLLAAALVANGAFGAGLLLLPLSLDERAAFSPRGAGALAAAAAVATILAGPLVGVVGDVAARRRSLYSASAALLASIGLGFALRPADPGWGAAFLAVAWGAAGAGLPALFPLAAARAGPEGAQPARVALVTVCHLGAGMFLLVAMTGAGPFLWVGLAAAAAGGGLVALCVKE
jgi:hypothetical protein